MTLTELRFIVALARERHFGRAAKACFVSQPTLSVAVRKLETELGVQLFERGLGEATPTTAGQRIIEQAQRVLEEAAAIKELAREAQDPLQGPLRVGAIYTIGPYLFPSLIPILHKRAPAMPLLIEESFTANLTERLKQGELDVILISLPFEEPGIAIAPLYDEPFVVVLPAAHPWNERSSIKAGQLADETMLLLGPGNCFRDQVLQLCPACHRSAGGMQRSLEGGSIETIRHMVASGIGVTVLPCTAAGADKYSRRLITIRPFTRPVPTRRVAVAWRSSFARPQAIEALRAAILACDLSCIKPLRTGRTAEGEP